MFKNASPKTYLSISVGGAARVSARGDVADDGRGGARQDAAAAGQVAHEAEQHKRRTHLRER